ncbi:GDP-L-fucose synthase family protein [Pontibacter chinhatensis]|uniref:GDP-L-fucose synthase n=1 Tax=Pontibacter chinhatensis TaxID=1436961 RepID=A0A1I2WZ87_9BACT|nr:GDP-L-fucose synthase [Pontibacter chinhatensis]SFH06654.1 GDP-L-fucose synthase [Pontibacter chinhatensis]
MNRTDKVFVAGHNGMVGSAIMRKLESLGYSNIVVRSSKELDLRNQQQVNKFFAEEKPDYVFLAAAKVGGIIANSTYQAEFIYDNLMIQNNVIHAAYLNNVKKLLFMGSSCIYPKFCPQPIKEEYLLTGTIEPTNEPYAIAKIAGIKLCNYYRAQYGCNFISVMPTNIYGPNDNYDLQNSHVLPALIRKFIIARNRKEPSVLLWGSGTPRREFLHADDLADALLFLMETYNEGGFINIGTGKDISILELARLVQKVVEYEGDILTDTTKPDGTPRKLMDVSRLLAMGWEAKISLEEGISKALLEAREKDWALEGMEAN